MASARVPVKIFQALRDKAIADQVVVPKEQRAMFWLKKYTTAVAKWQLRTDGLPYEKLATREFTKEISPVARIRPGFFYFYRYDAKWKNDLPYWDAFPFTLVLDVADDRFWGLNFHYLDYFHRARLFDLLYPFRQGRPSRPDVRDIRMHMKVTYSLLKLSSRYAAFKPCFKEYLKSHVTTTVMKVGAKEWDTALFLPVQRFQKEKASYVWGESRKMF